jgi:hypothetical protein
MSPRPNRSRKQSAASSTAARRREQAVFYLDESIHSRLLADRIRVAGATVRHPGDAFPFGTPDDIWLAECGANGWIVLTRDQHIRRRPLELASLRTAYVAAFAFTAGQATALETADAVELLLQKMVNISVSVPRPFLYTFGLGARLTRVRIRR